MDYDIVTVSETWLKRYESISIQGYKLQSLPRVTLSRAGVVGLFMKAEKAYQFLTSTCVSSDIFKVVFSKISGGPIVGVVYSPLSSLVQSFLQYLEAALERLSRCHGGCIVIVGDFNIDTSGETTLKIAICFNHLTCEILLQRQHVI